VKVTVLPRGVPVTVTVTPAGGVTVAPAAAVKVNVDMAVAGKGAAAGVTGFRVTGVEETPKGRPDKARLTLAVGGDSRVAETVIGTLAAPPAVIVTVDGLGAVIARP
jgi:hypothetical protein